MECLLASTRSYLRGQSFMALNIYLCLEGFLGLITTQRPLAQGEGSVIGAAITSD